MGLSLRHHRIAANGIQIHVAEVGSGPPVVVLHGYPENCYAWRKQWPALADRFHVFMPDLRGYGDSDKPATGYDKRTMAEDVLAVVRHFGHSRIALVGHDRGARLATRLATRLAKDYRQLVDRLVVMDNIPTRVVFNNTHAKLARQYWFFYFQQVLDLPEALVAGMEEIFLRHFYSNWTYDPTAITDADVAEYVRAYSQPGAFRGAFSDYRAGPQDLAQDIEDADALIDCPVLALWGADFDLVGKAFDVLEVWRGMTHQVRGAPFAQCGHLPQEEQPEVVNQELLAFRAGWND